MALRSVNQRFALPEGAKIGVLLIGSGARMLRGEGMMSRSLFLRAAPGPAHYRPRLHLRGRRRRSPRKSSRRRAELRASSTSASWRPAARRERRGWCSSYGAAATDQLRYVATQDIVPLVTARRETSEKAYVEFMRSQFSSRP